jgi:hypothetical protein
VHDVRLASRQQRNPPRRRLGGHRDRRPAVARFHETRARASSGCADTCNFLRAGLPASGGPDALCAETAHALVGVLAASPLTVGSKRKSAALRADFSFVAAAAPRGRGEASISCPSTALAVPLRADDRIARGGIVPRAASRAGVSPTAGGRKHHVDKCFARLALNRTHCTAQAPRSSVGSRGGVGPRRVAAPRMLPQHAVGGQRSSRSCRLAEIIGSGR